MCFSPNGTRFSSSTPIAGCRTRRCSSSSSGRRRRGHSPWCPRSSPLKTSPSRSAGGSAFSPSSAPSTARMGAMPASPARCAVASTRAPISMPGYSPCGGRAPIGNGSATGRRRSSAAAANPSPPTGWPWRSPPMPTACRSPCCLPPAIPPTAGSSIPTPAPSLSASPPMSASASCISPIRKRSVSIRRPVSTCRTGAGGGIGSGSVISISPHSGNGEAG